MCLEIIPTLHWHFEAKNFALMNALSLRCPLSVQESLALRLYYSEYFSHLVSAVEFLKEYSQGEKLDELIGNLFIFEGRLDGRDNYAYIRELRNSIVHRGLDITWAAHIHKEIPLVRAPSPVFNRFGTKKYESLGFYLIQVVEKCERLIGVIILEYLCKNGVLSVAIDQDKAVARVQELIKSSDHIPVWVKLMALENGVVDEIDFVAMQQGQVEKLKALLQFNALQDAIKRDAALEEIAARLKIN